VLAAFGVIAMLLIILRRARPVAQVTASLVAGVTWMAGLAAALNIKFNFFNFVALPTTFGIGVDYPVNIQQRYQQDGVGSIEHALRRTGPAVFIAALTTIIGYGVLLTSSSLVLASFGKLAIIGEVACLAAAMLLLPAIATLVDRGRAVVVPAEQPAPAPALAAASAGAQPVGAEAAAAHALGLATGPILRALPQRQARRPRRVRPARRRRGR
jgi:hypothetical protein